MEPSPGVETGEGRGASPCLQVEAPPRLPANSLNTHSRRVHRQISERPAGRKKQTAKHLQEGVRLRNLGYLIAGRNFPQGLDLEERALITGPQEHLGAGCPFPRAGTRPEAKFSRQSQLHSRISPSPRPGAPGPLPPPPHLPGALPPPTEPAPGARWGCSPGEGLDSGFRPLASPPPGRHSAARGWARHTGPVSHAVRAPPRPPVAPQPTSQRIPAAPARPEGEIWSPRKFRVRGRGRLPGGGPGPVRAAASH